MKPNLVFSLVGVGIVIAHASVASGGVIYSNFSGNQQYAYATGVYWDDLQTVGGGTLSRVRMHASNAQSGAPRVFNSLVSLHLFNDATGLPNGPQLGFFEVSSGTTIAPGDSRIVESADLTGLGITIPNNAKLGLRVSTGGNWGVIAYANPTVGSSQDIMWQGITPTVFTTSGVDNLGLELTTIPEPPAGALAIAGLLTVGIRRQIRGVNAAGGR